MSQRLFEDKDHAQSYVAYRPSYPDELINFVISEVKKAQESLDLAIDVGCGSGQNTTLIAKHFKKVIGTDISNAQIQEGISKCKDDNIEFICCPGEKVPAPDNSLDLITCAASFHWLDREAFFAEVQRTLKPGGCLAIYAYSPQISFTLEKIGDLFKDKIYDKIFEYAAPNVRKHWHERLRDEQGPFGESLWRDDFQLTRNQSLSAILGLHESYSFYRSFRKANPDQDIIADVKDRCCRLMEWEDSPDKLMIQTTVKYHILLTRKPKNI